MRLLAIVIVLSLSACASAPGGKQFYYRGVYAPGGVDIADDGSFAARTTVWNASKAVIAGEAALFRLEEAARLHGYSHAVIEDVAETTAQGHQVSISGMLYANNERAAGAVAVEELLDLARGGEMEEVATQRMAPQVTGPVRRAARPETPPQAVGDPAGEPVVIQAPEFISSLETGDPTG